MSDTPTAERIADLEERVADLEDRLAARERALSLLAGAANLDAVTATCPECRDAELEKRSGIRWSELRCPACETVWRL